MTRVHHVLDVNSNGIITAFMIRGNNHSYEVQWELNKCTWHLDFELLAKPIADKATIGFWSDSGKPNADVEARRK